MTRAKICGLTTEADLAAAVDAGADAVGVVTDVPVDTPRAVSVERAADLLATAPPFVAGVLVTMPESPDHAAELVESAHPDVLQVHDVPPDDVARIAAAVDPQVVAGVDAADPERARRYDGVADALLVDSTTESGAGGTGRTHDWADAAALADELDSPLALAGGLTPTNVAEAVRTVEPYAVDVATGTESESGRKDHDAVRAFVRAATAAGEGER